MTRIAWDRMEIKLGQTAGPITTIEYPMWIALLQTPAGHMTSGVYRTRQAAERAALDTIAREPDRWKGGTATVMERLLDDALEEMTIV